jgi:hypothetical protein
VSHWAEIETPVTLRPLDDTDMRKPMRTVLIIALLALGIQSAGAQAQLSRFRSACVNQAMAAR